jgi:hypothetical protein
MSITVLQRRPLYLAIALLFFTCGQVVAQATAADQTFKATPQQIKANAELKANAKANTVANSATDKLDSGMNKAWKGIGKMFKKKPKPGKDSVASAPTLPVNPGTPPPPVNPTTPPPATPPPPHPSAKLNVQKSLIERTVPSWRRRTGWLRTAGEC